MLKRIKIEKLFGNFDYDIELKEEGITILTGPANAGEMAGKEIVQFYIRDPQSRLVRPLKELKGFARLITKDVYDWLDPASAIKRRNFPGGTGADVVKKNISKAKKEISS